MGNFLKTQNSFALGEISPDFYAKNENNAVAKLENMDVLQSGGLRRRYGLKSVKKNIANNAILVSFPVSESEKYLLVIYELFMDIYCNDVKISTIATPWHSVDLSKLQYAQRFNKLFFVHPDYQPRVLIKNTSGFSIQNFSFHVNSDMSINIPFIKFDDTDGISISITSSSIDNNHATFTTNVDFWNNNSVGERLYVDGNQWIIESVQDARIAIAYTNNNFSFPQTPIYDWYESSFSNRRGWPISISFYQNRLIFGGTKSLPNNIWMSKIGDYYNFDVGEGLDDDAIYTVLLSAQHHQICTLVSSDKLQILTSAGEWAISNSPLTPSSVNIKQHTSVGSIATCYLPPQQIEGCTIFVSESGKDIRELDLDALGENYNSTDLCQYSKHLMNSPKSMSYNQMEHQLFIVMESGYIAVLNKYINSNISAWARYKTDGNFKYVCVLDNVTYVIVERNNVSSLEKFDATCLMDAETFGFSYTVSSFPMLINSHCPKKIRSRKISLRVLNTKTIFVNGYRIEIPNLVYDDTNPGYSGDLSTNLLGTQTDTIESLWNISSSEQLPATILSVTVDGWYEI